jgi:Tfp pilus assembly protein PilX
MRPSFFFQPKYLTRRPHRRGYIMAITMVMVVVLSIAGTTTLNLSGVDQRIASRNRQHMLVFNTSDAGTNHARNKLKNTQPTSEGFNANGAEDTSTTFVTKAAGETSYGGISYTHNLGVYYVKAVYQRCGNPPPGYSTEQGRASFRSDYWEMKSVGKLTNSSYTSLNATEAITTTLVRMVMRGNCKMR